MATLPSVPNTDRIASYSPASSTTDFAVPWPVIADSEDAAKDDLAVFVDGEQLDAAEFEFEGTAIPGVTGAWDGGTVVLDTAVSGVRVIVASVRDPRRTGHFVEGASLPATALDKLMNDFAIMQRDMHLTAKRSLKIPVQDMADGLGVESSTVTARAGKMLAWSAGGALSHSNMSLAQIEALGPIPVTVATNIVTTVAAMKALAMSAGLVGQLVFVTGYYADNDGGGGWFRITNVSPGADNGGTIIHSNTAGYYFQRHFQGHQVPPIGFGATEGGLVDAGPQLQKWLDWHQGRNFARVDRPATFLSNQALTSKVKRVDWGWSKILFSSGISHTSDLFTVEPLSGSDEDKIIGFENLQIDANQGGRDAIRFTNGFPVARDIFIRDSYQDAVGLYADGTLGKYIEKATIDHVYGYQIGRHFVCGTIIGAGGTSYVNRTRITRCEIRGIGRVTANSNFFAGVFDASVNHAASKFEGLVIEDNQIDGIKTGSVGNDGLGNCVHFYRNGGSNERVEGVSFTNNAVESTTGTYSPQKHLVAHDTGITLVDLVTSNNTRSGWCDDYDTNVIENVTTTLYRPQLAIREWTPTIVGSTTPGANTYHGDTYGLWWQEGRIVHARGTVRLTAKDGAMAGNIAIAGLPLKVLSSMVGSGMISRYADITVSAGTLHVEPVNGAKTANLIRCASGTVAVPIVAADISATTVIHFHLVYFKGVP